MPWDGDIRWKVEGPTVFDDPDEELDAVAHCRGFQSDRRSSDLWVFQYGLRYIPAAGESNIYRTVKIEQLHGSDTLHHIVPKIHGEVYSASVFNTSPITGSYTAIVTFVWQSDALDFIHATRESGLRVESTTVKPSLVNTPTYPMPAGMKTRILQYGYTRSIAISVPASNIDLLNQFLDESLNPLKVECREQNEAGEVCVRFHSIKVASGMLDLLKRSPGLGDYGVRSYQASQESRETAV